MKKRIAVCLLVGLMVVSTFTGCGNGSTNESCNEIAKTENKTDKPTEDIVKEEKETTNSNDNLTEDLSEYSNIEWPDTEVASAIPKPKFTLGKIAFESDEGLLITFANVSEDDYTDYVEACKQLGYTIDHVMMNSMYSAKNENGYTLMVTLESDHTMSIMTTLEDN